MATRYSQREDSIPDLTNSQYESLSEYTQRHQQAPDKLSPNPYVIARVLTGDRPAAYINPATGVTPDSYSGKDEYLTEVFGRLGLVARKIDGDNGWNVARTAWRLDLLPTTNSLSDAYHRRLGVVYGYPEDAIEYFINNPDVTVTYCDLARSGIFSAEDIAYASIFVPYTHEKSIPMCERLIERGKMIRKRISELSDTWNIPELDQHAEDVHQDVASVYSGNGGTFNASTMFHPDVDVKRSDVEPLLSG